MKTITIRLPEPLAAEIEAESEERNISKSDVVRERLLRADKPKKGIPSQIADLIGSVEGDFPVDLSENKKQYLRTMGYGRKHNR